MLIGGVIIGAGVCLIIGLLHAVIIKCEYYWGVKVWLVFLVFGPVCIGA